MSVSEGFEAMVLDKLAVAYLEARKGKRATVDEHSFEMHDMERLLYLREQMLSRQYTPSRGIAFITRHPVIREIFAAPFIDRVVHHFLFNEDYPWWDVRLDVASSSCRVGKGTLYGIKRLASQLQSASDNYTKPMIIKKLDIQGCFMSFPREGLYKRVLWGLDQRFGVDKDRLYWLERFLWEQVIFDDPTKGVVRRGHLNDWDDLPKSKSLFNQPPGRGMVIGNLTSQLLSNVYLDDLDRFVRFELGYKYYGRYVDDFYIIVPAEELKRLERDVKRIEEFLAVRLGLTLHPKKRYTQPMEHGVEFLGARIVPNHILPGKRVTKNFEVAAHEFMMGLCDTETIQSYIGILGNYESDTVCKRVFESVGWDYQPTDTRTKHAMCR